MAPDHLQMPHCPLSKSPVVTAILALSGSRTQPAGRMSSRQHIEEWASASFPFLDVNLAMSLQDRLSNSGNIRPSSRFEI